MASLIRDPLSGVYRIKFRFAGKQIQKSLRTTKAKEAASTVSRIEGTLADIERGRLILPAGADLWTFLLTDGKATGKPSLAGVLTIGDLFTWFVDSIPPTSKEEATFKTWNVHRKHFERIMGASKNLSSIIGNDLQGYVNHRARERHGGKLIKAVTINKELDTLQMVWNRAKSHGLAACGYPAGIKLELPKHQAKEPFRTWKQLEASGKPGPWENLFLNVVETTELLAWIEAKETRSHYFYPLCVFAAHTGARLSEIMRSEKEDFDFEGKQVKLREKKKSQAGYTYRIVDMTARLAKVMQDYWRSGHPGGRYTISREHDTPMTGPTLQEAHEWFFTESKWTVLKGYHVFRHSYASNLAAAGVDQQYIDDLMGHQTEEMRKRYRHLFPEDKRKAVAAIFG